MKLVTYIENKYQESTLAAHNSPQYALWLDSEVKALHQILNGIRIMMKWIHIVVFPFQFAAVLLGITPAPRPVLKELAALNKQKEEAEKAKETVKNIQNQ
jgi:hypothetical protein